MHQLPQITDSHPPGPPTSDLRDAGSPVARAARLRPLLEANAARCETERRIVDANLAALSDAGLFGVIVPKRAGGTGATMTTQIAVASELAKGCASTAWVQTLINVTSWAASLLPPDGHREVFNDARGARVCGVLTPSAKAVPVDGGYRVTGKWAFASGCLHADWATGGVVFEDPHGAPLNKGMVYMPVAELKIQDTWHVAGMRGTGSHTLVADEVFVPYRRALGGAPPAGFDAGTPLPAEPSDRWPVPSVLALVLLGPALGMAEAILESVRAATHKRGVSYTTYDRQIHSQVLLHDLAKAALHVETARLHVYRCAAEIDGAGAGQDLDSVGCARLRGACGYATEALRTAADLLVSIGGASCFAESNPIQRHWRDLNVATRHAFLATAPCIETYGRALVGAEPIFQFL